MARAKTQSAAAADTQPAITVPLAGPADVIAEVYDNEGKAGVTCELTLRDGTTLVGACARSDELTLAETQRAAYAAAFGEA